MLANHILEGHRDEILDMKIYKDYMFSGSDDKSIILWDLKRSKLIMLSFNNL